MESCLYEGVVRHERLTPVNHRFDYRLYMAYLDLAEVPSLIRSGVLSEGLFGAAAFARRDHFGDSKRSLDECLRDLVLRETAVEATGPIRVLTLLRCFGYYFSPLTMYYCFADDGERLRAVVAMVRNTPWRERHAYVLWSGNQGETPGSHRHGKKLHVSPFMNMDVEYRWRLNAPKENLAIAIDNAAGNEVFFRAALQLQRSPLTRASLRRMQFRYPFMTARITASIYHQAFRLWRKKCPLHSHPKHLSQCPASPNGNIGPDSSNASAGAA